MTPDEAIKLIRQQSFHKAGCGAVKKGDFIREQPCACGLDEAYRVLALKPGERWMKLIDTGRALPRVVLDAKDIDGVMEVDDDT